MKVFAVAIFVALAWRTGCGRSLPEEDSVVSVYTTQPTTAGTGFDVYHQIANNIAERISSPIYRFLGITRNKTEEQPAVKAKPWGKIELLDEMPEDVTKAIEPVDNDISEDRDVEELSVEALKKVDKKPEKITLFSSYLPVKENLDSNNTINEIPDNDDDDAPFEFDDFDTDPRAESPFIFILEWLASFWQIISGAFESIFGSNSSKDS
ncbi:uncharacterized protein LOC113240671 [Hyposmocoma kahamanoa]|uniref:uncharacterized protein LOC113240671 n=1 Tax=Hyposmocoma kahamanoa TaxID=1477025 RepID=UPI000E6D9C8B|nr:uncharacterized protein LOC113240671 [Hyposmocoma kahamanoa]